MKKTFRETLLCAGRGACLIKLSVSTPGKPPGERWYI
jgi:hypothetical protein